MWITFDHYGGSGNVLVENGNFECQIDKLQDLEDYIRNALTSGIPSLAKFKNEGIPGKYKVMKTLDNQEDIISFLHSLKRKYGIRNIRTGEEIEDVERCNIISIDELRFKRLIGQNSCIREFADRYEYCIIKDYEELYDDFICDSIQINEIFVQLLTVNGRNILVSIEFSKDNFTLKDAMNWLSKYNVCLVEDKNSDTVENADSIIHGVKFRGVPIILFERGYKKLKFNKTELREVVDEFIPNSQKVDTGASKKVNQLTPGLKIILNGVEIDYIPEIHVDLTRDLVFSNGNIMVAGFIGEYGGYIGFFEEEDDDLPIAWLHDNNTTVYIDVYQKRNGKVIIIESKYIIDLDDF